MYVQKRDGRKETVHFDKILERNRILYEMAPCLSPLVNIVELTQKVISGLYDGIQTSEIDSLTAETAAFQSTTHPDYGVMAGRLCASNLQKLTLKSFVDTMELCYKNVDENGNPAPLVTKDLIKIMKDNKEEIESAIVHERDFTLDFFSYRTLERAYLLRVNNKVVETPQYMFMRVAMGIHRDDINSAINTYQMMSTKMFIHATPTLFSAASPRPQMASCFLLAMKDDSLDGIFDTIKDCAMISKTAGGIGLSISNIRASGSYIAGTGGHSNGIIPLLRCLNNVSRYVDQGGGKRAGSFAIYIEPHHADIFDFLELRKNHGKEEMRARDLFLALWLSDLFMKRVENNEKWTLFCPKTAPGLCETYGEEYETLYTKYEEEGKGIKVVKAQDLWNAIMVSIIETGVPYMLSKDSSNEKSNQRELGTIRSSNLCAEIIEYSDKNEIAVCNLASIGLPSCVVDKKFDFKLLDRITRTLVINLNKVIDGNYYPLLETKSSNMKHRPIGIGVQGLADVFMMLKMPFASKDAKELNKKIFERIYFTALSTSSDLALTEGPYPTYHGSPLYTGELQPDMWNLVLTKDTSELDWTTLRAKINMYGARNSLLIALMPTASTSQILGYNECFEPYTSNIYTRRVKAGEFVVVNKHLLNDLIERNLWTKSIKNKIIANQGSVALIDEIPNDLKEIYKTVWEIPQRDIIDMAADRGPFICQSQSMNLFFEELTRNKLSSALFYAWKKGLKTLSYYCRTRAASDPIQFTVDQDLLNEKKSTTEEGVEESCPMHCLSCGS